jgi:hypothetical protein
MVESPSSGVPKTVFARDYEITSEMVYQYLRQANLG